MYNMKQSNMWGEFIMLFELPIVFSGNSPVVLKIIPTFSQKQPF